MFAEYLKESFYAIVKRPVVAVKAIAPSIVVGVLILIALGVGMGMLMNKNPMAWFLLMLISMLLAVIYVLLSGTGAFVAGAIYAGIEKRDVFESIKRFLPRYFFGVVLYVIPFVAAFLLLAIPSGILSSSLTNLQDLSAVLLGGLFVLCLYGVFSIVYLLGMVSFFFRLYKYRNRGALAVYKEQLGMLLKKKNLKFALILILLGFILWIPMMIVNAVFNFVLGLAVSTGIPSMVAFAVLLVIVAMVLISFVSTILLNTFGFKYLNAYKL